MTSASTRTIGGIGWNIWRAFIGIAYLAAAVFNTVYTLPRSDQHDGYADNEQEERKDQISPRQQIRKFDYYLFQHISNTKQIKQQKKLDFFKANI